MAETFTKRHKELVRQRRKKDKLARRQERKEEKARSDPPPEGEDPDIAGIIPGPQPKLYE